MTPFTTLENALKDSLRVYLHERECGDVEPSLERSSLSSLGDFSINLGFVLAKRLGKAPLAVAEEIAAHLMQEDIEGVASVSAVAPGYVNISLDDGFLGKLLEGIRNDRAYGQNEILKGEVWALEHTSPNPTKAMHLGHLRNNLVGMSIGHILEASGAHVIYEAVDNNRGIAIAKLMWGFLSHMRKAVDTPIESAYWREHKGEWYTPNELFLFPDVYVSQCYEKGSEDAKNPELEEKIRGLVVAWEAHDEATWELWSHVLSYSYEGMDRTLRRLKNRWDKVWHEHEHYEKGKEYVAEGLEKGLFKKLEDGAVLIDLSAYNIPDTILLKRDGTSLYLTQDLALTALKKETHHADHLVWVVGPDQSLALRQLFAVAEQLGIGTVSEFTHIPYGYVTLKDGEGGIKKMSSREGTVLLIDDVIDAVHNTLLAEVLTSDIKDKDALAEALALAAVKFNILRSDRMQALSFDVKNAIETKGDSGVYVMYAYVRARSILRKATALGKKAEVGASAHGREVIRELMWYPFAVLRAKNDLSPHHIAQYLLDLSGAFNQWYNAEIVLDGGQDEMHKLAIVEAVAQVLKRGLSLLNIDTVEEM